MEQAKGLQDEASAKNKAYERAKQEALQAAYKEQRCLEEWAAAKRKEAAMKEELQLLAELAMQ